LIILQCMPRKNVIKQFIPQSFYHIYNRGLNKTDIFVDEQDYHTFLSYLKTYLLPKDTKTLNQIISNPKSSAKEKDKALKVLRLNNFSSTISLVAYCLMPNHFHFLIYQETDRVIVQFMKSAFTRYVGYFNHRHDRYGPLFESHYKAVVIKSDEQLIYLSRYIHTNPAKSNINQPDSNPLSQPSSYPNYLGTINQKWVRPETVLAYFNNKQKMYQNFIEQQDSDIEEKTYYLLPHLPIQGWS